MNHLPLVQNGIPVVHRSYGRAALCSLITLGFFIGGFVSINADTITLRNGQVLEGQIVTQDRLSVLLRSNGRVRRLQKTDIRRIKYGKAAPKVQPQPKAPKAPAEGEPAAKGGQHPATSGSVQLPLVNHDFSLGLRFGILSGRHDSDFEERTVYERGFLSSAFAASSLSVAPAWSDNAASGAELGADLFYRGLMLDIEIINGKQETPEGSATYAGSGPPFGIVGGAVIERSSRTMSGGYGQTVLGVLRVGAQLGVRELLLEEQLGEVLLYSDGTNHTIALRGTGARGLVRGPVYSMRLLWQPLARLSAGLLLQRYFLRGGRTMDSANLYLSDSAGTQSASLVVSPASAQYRHSGSRIRAQVAVEVAPDWWLFGSHMLETARVRYSQLLTPSGGVASNGTLFGGLDAIRAVESQHRERFKVTILGIERRLYFSRP